MTLEDFENWIINFLWEDPRGNLLSLDDYMKLAHIMIKHGISVHKTHPESLPIAYKTIKFQFPIIEQLNKIESEEDIAFLTLKYSEYIL